MNDELPQDAGQKTSASLPPLGQPSDVIAPHAGLSEQDKQAIQALPSGSALLIMHTGPGAGSRFLLDEPETTVGRHPKAAIFLDDFTVSRKHAMFLREDDGSFTIRDSGSLNGTYVNRTRIDSWTLRPGDEVQIGKYRLVYYSNASAEPSPVA